MFTLLGVYGWLVRGKSRLDRVWKVLSVNGFHQSLLLAFRFQKVFRVLKDDGLSICLDMSTITLRGEIEEQICSKLLM